MLRTLAFENFWTDGRRPSRTSPKFSGLVWPGLEWGLYTYYYPLLFVLIIERAKGFTWGARCSVSDGFADLHYSFVNLSFLWDFFFFIVTFFFFLDCYFFGFVLFFSLFSTTFFHLIFFSKLVKFFFSSLWFIAVFSCCYCCCFPKS